MAIGMVCSAATHKGKHACDQLHTSMQGETREGSNPSPHKEPGRVQPFPARGIGRGTSPSRPKYNGTKQTHGSVALSDLLLLLLLLLLLPRACLLARPSSVRTCVACPLPARPRRLDTYAWTPMLTLFWVCLSSKGAKTTYTTHCF